MKLENVRRQTKSRALLITLAFIVSAGLLIGMPLYRSVSAQKSLSGGTAGATAQENQTARAVLDQAIKDGTFELMSSAKQQQLLLRAGMRFEDGVLKEMYPIPPSQPAKPAEPLPPGKTSASLIESPQSPLANPQVNNPALDATAQKTQSETTIVLTGANSAISVYNDSGSFIGVNSFTGYSTSTDMGSTWTDRGIVPLLGDQNFGDPVLARSAATGSVFLSTLAGGANGINIYRSTDGGVTFSTVANGAPTASSNDTDKEWIAVDNFVGTGNGNVYHVYRDFGAPNGIYFTRSTNDGISFSNPLLIVSGASGNVQGAFVFVGADHAVYAGFYDSSTNPDRIAIRKSTDLGLTFAATVGVSNLVTTGTNGSLNVPAGYRSSAFPQFVASPTNANLLFEIHPDITVAGGSDSNIFFQQSTDGGATWSANQKLNTDPTTRVQTQPAIAITPDGTALCVTWQDSRNDVANRRVQRFGVIGTISGTTVTFGPNFQVSQPDWNPVFGQDPVVNSVYMGDYDTMAADNSFFYTTFVDCRLGDQDVRFAKIPKAGPGEILAVTNVNPTSLAVATSTCNDLFVTLTNNGTATATGVSLALTTATPGVTIQNTPQGYGDIAAGASATNATPFKLSISNTFVCGTPIVINWTASTGETGSFTINTQGLGYSASTMTGQSIVPGTTDVGNHTDDGTTFISLPFNFTFYGQNFTGANVSSNGNLQFTSNNNGFTNACLPTAAMNNLISPFWDDLRTDQTAPGIFTSISGLAPNRIFNIEWRAIHFSTGGTFNFEIRLFETTGQIDLVYGTIADGTNNNGSSATVGLQKGTGSGGPSDFTQFSCNTPSLAPGLKISYTVLTNCPTGMGACAVAVPCAENFDTVTPPALPTGWSATTGVTCANSAPWVTSNVTPDTVPNDAFVNDPNCISDERLDSKPFPITGTPAVLTFRHTFALESSFDGGVVEISSPNINAGAFTDIITAGGSFVGGTQAYNGTISVNFGNPIGGRQAFTGTNAGGFGVYVTTSINLPAVTNGQSVIIRWRRGTDSSAAGTGWRVDTVSITNSNCGAPCVLTCPANITKSNDPNQCGAVTTYAAPTSTGTCGTITCTPPSGSFFPVGTTTVTCADSGGATCSFTVTVNDTQPPTITCPANQTAVTDQACGASSCQVVNFPPPTATDNCPGVTVVCNPPAGSCFPTGTTSVTCTATDGSGNTASCSFSITVFDARIQDDAVPTNVLLFNTTTGEFRFCCNGILFSGVGKVTKAGCIFSLSATPVQLRVQATLNKATFNGTASLQAPPGSTRCTLTDRDTRNDTQLCQ
ncbi:MAG TPA: HYR domain-containing protein [Blastocatellia bacterium]|nr:HYR domain-containing protein [Blastocatellia bacterium]